MSKRLEAIKARLLSDLAALKVKAGHSAYHHNILQTMEMVAEQLDPDQAPDSVGNTNTMTLVETLMLAATAIPLPDAPEQPDTSTLN